MIDLSTLQSLLARVEAATGPDHDLAVAILSALDIADYCDDSDDPTYSIDAALALTERLLPGWWVSVWNDESGGWGATLDCREPRTTIVEEAYRANGSLAILSALLRALIAQHKEPSDVR